MAGSRKRTEWLQFGSGTSYFHRTHQPLQCLIFITPLLLFYQIASVIHPWQPGNNPPPQVVAFVLTLKFFRLFGVAGNIVPLLAVVSILICWHLARKDKWELEPALYGGMAFESIIWGIPIFVIGMALAKGLLVAVMPIAQSTTGSAMSWQNEVVLSIGAGIYEELLFRLVAITILNIILVDVFELRIQTAIPIIIITSAILFSAYHYLGTETFSMGVFVFRTGLGVYLAGVYIYRGFGIAVGTHAVYDLILTLKHATH